MTEAPGDPQTPKPLHTRDGSATTNATPGEPADPNERVLIVDDHESYRQIARQILTAGGLLVVGEAADGAEAIQACEALHPNIVVLDIQLPDIDGFTVATTLASLADAPAVVLVSSRSRTDYGSRIEDCGAQGYIAKAELSGDAIRRLIL